MSGWLHLLCILWRSLRYRAETSVPASDVFLPSCQEATRRPRTSSMCSYPPRSNIMAHATPENTTECTDASLCEALSSDLPAIRCNMSFESFNVSINDGVQDRVVYMTYPRGCSMPAAGWPFVLFFGFDQVHIPSPKSTSAEILYQKTNLLHQGVAFMETTMYWNDTYDNRECNSFELGAETVSSGTCRSCLQNAQPECVEKRHWFTCGNYPQSRDVTLLANLFQSIRDGKMPKTGAAWDLDVDAMAYIGWSVGGHMTSRAIELGARGAPFPVPRAGVMISGASYQCYECPATAGPHEPTDEFERCNWYSQGFQANGSNNSCGTVFGPFTSQQNHWGVCPGYTLYPNATAWWEINTSTQSPTDVLRTEASWDNCSKTFDEHPAVLLAQPWEDSFAYWNAAQNYYEVLARQKGGRGCRMYAGQKIHGPAPTGDLGTLNFLLRYLAPRDTFAAPPVDSVGPMVDVVV